MLDEEEHAAGSVSNTIDPEYSVQPSQSRSEDDGSRISLDEGPKSWGSIHSSSVEGGGDDSKHSSRVGISDICVSGVFGKELKEKVAVLGDGVWMPTVLPQRQCDGYVQASQQSFIFLPSVSLSAGRV